MSENKDILETADQEKTCAEMDTEEQDFLERLSNFGEGYFDFATYLEVFEESGETGLSGA